jgi:ATP-binding cassette subfamily B protein
VKANPVTGRVLIFYSPETPGLDLGLLLRQFLDEQSTRHEEPAPNGATDSSLARVVRPSLPSRQHLATPPLLSLMGHTLGLLQGLTFMTIFNTARGEGPGFLRTLGLTRTGPRLVFITALSLLLSGVSHFVQHLRKRAWRKLAQTTQHNLRTQLIARIETQDMAFFDRYGTGRIISLVTQDTERVGDFVERAGDEAIERALTIIVSGGLLILVSPSLALLGGLTLPFILLSTRLYGGKVTESYAGLAQAGSGFSQMLENNLSGIADVKSFTAEEQEIERLREGDLTRADAAVRATSVSSLQSQMTGAIFAVGFALTAGYGGRQAAAGRITQTEYFRAAYWFPQLLGSLMSIGQITQLYHGAVSSAGKLAEVLDSEPQIRSGPVRLPRKKVRGELLFENVSFGYDPSVKVLEDVSFSVEPGKTVAIVGPTGSGKSTLLNLLLRFFDVDEGRVLLDGRDIRECDLHDLRAAISLVSQDVHLFEGTVRENVLYGQQGAPQSRIVKAMRDAGASELLKTLPGGLEARVGERGHRLSGGERQRVAIARALLKLYGGASILALDEATSHLDSETEAAIKKSLRKASSGKCVIMIAHRLSTIRSADKIIVLERGRIIEEGTHDQLLKRKDLYASLWHLQNEDPFGGELEVSIRR